MAKFQFFILISLLFLLQSVIAQKNDTAFLNSSIYTKVYDTSNIRLDSGATNLFNFNLYDSLYQFTKVKRPFTGLNTKLDQTYRIKFKEGSPQNLIDDLESLAYIEYAERIPAYKVNYEPNDLQSEQYYLDRVNAKGAWDVAKGNQNVVIAVVDNAVLTSQEDLTNRTWTNEDENGNDGIDNDVNGYTDDTMGYDVADDNNDPNPPSKVKDEGRFSHGTHVAGLTGAHTDNGKGIASLAFNTRIMPVKCSPDTSDGAILTNAYEGVYYAIQNNADVISMSWGGPNMTVTGSNIFQTADDMGIVMIGAAGNDDTDQKYYPAGYEEVIAVGATNKNDQKAIYSNFGDWIEVMAPGSNIYSCLAGTQSSYGTRSGTSMACPLVSSLAALIKADDPGKSNEMIRKQIKQSCDDIDDKNPSYQGQLGAGRINAAKAMNTTVGINNFVKNSKPIEVYPNPANDQFKLGGPQIGSLNAIYLKTINAKTVKIWDQAPTKGAYAVDELNPGVYILEIHQQMVIHRKRLIIQ